MPSRRDELREALERIAAMGDNSFTMTGRQARDAVNIAKAALASAPGRSDAEGE